MLSDDEMLKLCGCEASSPTALVVLAIGRAVERAVYERAAQECHAQKGGLSSEWGDGHDTGCDDCFAAIRALGRQHD